MKTLAAYQGKFGIRPSGSSGAKAAPAQREAPREAQAPQRTPQQVPGLAEGRYAPQQQAYPAQPQRYASAPPVSAAPVPAKRKKSKKKKHRRRVIIAWIIVLVLVVSYLLAFWVPWVHLGADGRLHTRTIFGKFQNKIITNSRESMRFQWVQYFFPSYIRELYDNVDGDARTSQFGFISEMNPEDIKVTDPINGEPETQATLPPVEELSEDQIAFYELFWELDFDSTESYLKAHPDVLENGYGRIYINEAGLNDEGTSIRTTKGEQVLAIDAYNGVLLVRITGEGYRGVLATAKDPTRFLLGVSNGISSVHGFTGYGQTAGSIARNYNGILAISGSGFNDPEGNGTGGEVAGICRSQGKDYGWAHRLWGCKRLEMHEDHWLYVTDAPLEIGSTVTDAMEFEPAMICDGQRQPNYVYTSENPRACVGQNDYGEILLLGIEGRRSDCPGCSVSVCTDILLEHRCITAMNMDGGTSAMLWFDGEPVIRCSNQNTPEGRYLPNAWVYVRKDG